MKPRRKSSAGRGTDHGCQIFPGACMPSRLPDQDSGYQADGSHLACVVQQTTVLPYDRSSARFQTGTIVQGLLSRSMHFAVFCDFKQQQIELANHIACLPMIRLFETESKLTRTNIASQMCGEPRTPIENISARLKILNLMSDSHVISAIWS